MTEPRRPRRLRLVAAWLVAYFSVGIFYPVVAAAGGVVLAYGVEFVAVLRWSPVLVQHYLDRELEDADGRLYRWQANDEIEREFKSRMFEQGAKAIESTNPTFFARAAVGDKYVTATGSNAACTLAQPGSLTMALTGACTGGVNPGETVWVRDSAGPYTTNATTKRLLTTVNGTANAPIKFRRYLNEIPVIDCNADLSAANSNGQCTGTLNNSGQYTWIWGWYITNTSTQSRLSPDEAGNHGPTTMGEMIISATGARAIHNWIRGSSNAILKTAIAGGITTGEQHLDFNYSFDNGYWGTIRSYGHDLYIKNGDSRGEAGRSYIYGHVGLRSWQVGDQFYSTTDTVSYITQTYSIEAASGHGTSPNANWSARGVWNPYYLGTSGGGATSCHSLGSKTLYKTLFDHNIAYGGGGGLVFGATKGSCDNTVTNNLFYEDGVAMQMTTPSSGVGGTWAPLTLTGNTFIATPDGSGGCPAGDSTCAATFTAAHYPSNTYLSTYPSSGQERMYVPDATYELGWGWVWVGNWDLAANVTIDLAAMGAQPNQAYKVYNWQDYDPKNSTAIASGTCVGTCGSISVASTISAGSITPTLLTTDGSTSFGTAPDLGPRTVVFFVTTNLAATVTPTPTATASQTPTRTNTPSLTPTFTSTRTSSPTATLTATITPSQSPTASNTPTRTFTASATFTASPTRTNTPTLTPTLTATPVSVLAPTFEAEACQGITTDAGIVIDADASGGRYVSSSVANRGKVACTFRADSAGTYVAWAHVYSPDTSHDSWFIDMDGDSLVGCAACMTDGNTTNVHKFDALDRLTPTDDGLACDAAPHVGLLGRWFWNPVNDRSVTSGPCSGTGTLRTFALTAATHTLSFRGREETSRLDKLILTTNLNYDPNEIETQGSTTRGTRPLRVMLPTRTPHP